MPVLSRKMRALPAVCLLTLTAPAPAAIADDKAGEPLQIVSAGVAGVRPGTPFLHLVGVSSRPEDQRFSANGLPKGLSIDRRSGVISGTAPAKTGTYEVDLVASARTAKPKMR